MVNGTYRFAAKYKEPVVIGRHLSLPAAARWAPTLALWGGGALTAVLFMADSIPLYRQNILSKLPVVGSYYDDSIDPEDSPF